MSTSTSSIIDAIATDKYNQQEIIEYATTHTNELHLLIYTSIYFQRYSLALGLLHILNEPLQLPIQPQITNIIAPLTHYLILASIHGNLQVFQSLLTRNLPIAQVGYIGVSIISKFLLESNCLSAAIISGNYEIIELILQTGKEQLNTLLECKTIEKYGDKEPELNGYTPLMLAIAYRKTKIFKLLVKGGSSLHPKDAYFNNIIHLCVKYNSTEELELLVDLYKEGLAHKNKNVLL